VNVTKISDMVRILGKGKVYRTMVRPVLIYGSETWTMNRR